MPSRLNFGVFLWARRLTTETLRADALAALTLAVVLVPQGLAYATLAGLPPVYGLYAGTVPLVVFGLLTSSSQVAVGPVAPSALLLAALAAPHVANEAEGGPNWVRVHLALAALAGGMQLAGAAAGVGGLAARLLSWPVMSGFSSGAAVLIAVSQVGELLGLPRSSLLGAVASSAPGGTLRAAAAVVAALPAVHAGAALLGVSALVLLLSWRSLTWRGARLLPAATPMPLLIVLGALVISWGLGLAKRGLRVVGPIPAALPAAASPLPSSAAAAVALLPAAALFAATSFVQTVALAEIFGRRVREAVAPNVELAALGAASLVG